MSELATTAIEQTATTHTLASRPDGARGFDFFYGRWRGWNRRLVERLVGCQEWEEFESTVDCWPMLGGLANADEYRTDHFPGFRGMTVRLFDPTAQQWAIYWADNRVGVLDPPVRGVFIGEVGIFAGPDVHAGRAILSRFTWRRGASPRWEQAFSADGGQTWETNWTVDFTRL
jgi:hypothetical protein